MKKRLLSLVAMLVMLVGMMPAFTLTANAATAPKKFWVETSDANNIPIQIDLFKSGTVYQLYLPGNAVLDECYLSWDGDMQAVLDGKTYDSGSCPIPAVDTQTTYSFKSGSQTSSFDLITYQGSKSVQSVFIDIDETQGTIKAMDGDTEHETSCTGRININGIWYDMPKIKGRGNATWEFADDKKPYNVTIQTTDGKKINFPGVSSEKTKKWSFLAEVTDHSLLSNRSGYYLGEKLGIGQSTTSADVWMNGEYQGCYTVTPKTDSFVTKNGFMIEQDNYLEASVANGGDPQFKLTGLEEASGWSSCYNRISVKKMGDNLLLNNDVVDESPENMEAVALNTIKPWLQDAWDAIRSDTGFNSKGKYYTEYIDIESFAKMYLMHEYAKSYDVCAGSILFHRDGMTDDDKLIAGPVWDLDNAMGSTCSNNYLGQGKDRRSGEGSFIPIITEYKTSIYKTISKHDDFMVEVYRQYNKYRSSFDSLPDAVNQMTNEIADSAKMNHYKVNEVSGTQYKNTHVYSKATTLGSGQYVQNYLATTNSKSDWANYAANLKTYVTCRSLWFKNTYYDENYVCEHDYEAVVTEPTCTVEGRTTYTCKYCGDSYEANVTPVIAHDYQNGVCTVCGENLINVDISCSEGASVTVLKTQNVNDVIEENATSTNPRNGDTGLIDCSSSGQVNFIVNLDNCYELENVSAAPQGTYKNLKGPGDTGITNGYRLTKVSGNLTITVNATPAHDYTETITDPTCIAKGVKTLTCTKCGDVKTEEIEALGHNMTEHAAVSATCTTAGNSAYWSCDRCGKYFSDAEGKTEIEENSWIISSLGHNMTAHAAVSATCTTAGNSAYWNCDRCDRYYSDAAGNTEIVENSWVITATGHKFADDFTVDKEATCTEEGSKSKHCTNANCDVKTEVTAIPKSAHSYGSWSITKEATCTTDGSKEKVCAVCGDKVTETIPATGHKFAEDFTVDKEPTCTVEGSKSKHCTNANCDVKAEVTAIPKSAHSYGSWSITKEATCTEDGSREKVCTACGEKVTETIPATGHKYADDFTVDKEATCTEEGSKSKHCTNANCDAVTESEVIPATGHNLTYFAAKAATTTAAGNIEYWYCNTCKKYFTDEEGQSETTQAATIIPKLPDDTGGGSSGGGSSGGGGGGVSPGGDEPTVTPEEEAKPVADAINALSADVPDPAAVAAVRAAYNKLSSEAKKSVPADVLKKLEAAEVKVTASLVEVLDEKHPDPVAVAEARSAYENLSDGAKAAFPAETLNRLKAAEATVIANEQKAEGAETVVSAGTVTVTSTENKTVAFTAASSSKRSITIPASVEIAGEIFTVTEISSGAFKDTAATTVTISKNIKKVKSKAFSGSKATKLIVKSKKLTKKNVKNSLKGSKVKTVKVKVGTWKQNKIYVKKYKRIFTKTNAGKKVTVK